MGIRFGGCSSSVHCASVAIKYDVFLREIATLDAFSFTDAKPLPTAGMTSRTDTNPARSNPSGTTTLHVVCDRHPLHVRSVFSSGIMWLPPVPITSSSLPVAVLGNLYSTLRWMFLPSLPRPSALTTYTASKHVSLFSFICFSHHLLDGFSLLLTQGLGICSLTLLSISQHPSLPVFSLIISIQRSRCRIGISSPCQSLSMGSTAAGLTTHVSEGHPRVSNPHTDPLSPCPLRTPREGFETLLGPSFATPLIRFT